MFLTLEEWDRKNFSKPHSLNTLRCWARTGQIYPQPQKVGREYQVDENSRYVDIRKYDTKIDAPVVRRVFNGV